MSASTFMTDGDFDALVDTLHALTQAMQDRGEIDRWQIRMALGEHGVLPLRTASDPVVEDSLVASLRSIRRGRSGALQAA